MKTTIASTVALAATTVASATMTEWTVSRADFSTGGLNLVRYEVFATFNGPTDTLLNVFNMALVSSTGSDDPFGGFWHKDNSSGNSGNLSQQYGTWSPAQVGSPTLNRPFDSFLMIGGVPSGTNSTQADPSWGIGGSGIHAGNASGWNRPDLTNAGTLGWYNANPPTLQGRVGVSGNGPTTVKIGQFILSAGHGDRTFVLTAGYNSGVPGTQVQFFTGNFTLPAPGALALLGLAGLARNRRR
jgi:hypothetical protein